LDFLLQIDIWILLHQFVIFWRAFHAGVPIESNLEKRKLSKLTHIYLLMKSIAALLILFDLYFSAGVKLGDGICIDILANHIFALCL